MAIVYTTSVVIWHRNTLYMVWKLWTEARPFELLDSLSEDPVVQYEIIRSIHIGLLCLQQESDDRPNMSAVVLMLNGESMLPQPKTPGLLVDFIPSKRSSMLCKSNPCLFNNITITIMGPRD